MYFTKQKCLSVLAGLLIAAPIWAAHTNSISWNVSSLTTIGGTQIQPGEYVIRVDDGGTQAEIMSRAEMDVDGGKVTQIKLGGKTSAISFGN
jgi:hypothetical protein